MIEKLALAIVQGNYDMVVRLVESDRNVLSEKYPKTQDTAVHIAIRYVSKAPDLKIIKYILDIIKVLPHEQKQAIINAGNFIGITALHLAVRERLMDVSDLLLGAGINHEATTPTGYTARDLLQVTYPQDLEKFDRLVKVHTKKQEKNDNELSTTKKARRFESSVFSESTPLLSREYSSLPSDSRQTSSGQISRGRGHSTPSVSSSSSSPSSSSSSSVSTTDRTASAPSTDQRTKADVLTTPQHHLKMP